MTWPDIPWPPSCPPIVVDTREQTPLPFPAWAPTVRAGLKSGDYSLEGWELNVAVERKSLADLVACCGPQRARFERELARLRILDRAWLAIEARDWTEIWEGATFSRLGGKSIVQSVISWTTRYKVGLLIAPRAELGWLVSSHLAMWWRQQVHDITYISSRSGFFPLSSGGS